MGGELSTLANPPPPPKPVTPPFLRARRLPGKHISGYFQTFSAPDTPRTLLQSTLPFQAPSQGSHTPQPAATPPLFHPPKFSPPPLLTQHPPPISPPLKFRPPPNFNTIPPPLSSNAASAPTPPPPPCLSRPSFQWGPGCGRRCGSGPPCAR